MLDSAALPIVAVVATTLALALGALLVWKPLSDACTHVPSIECVYPAETRPGWAGPLRDPRTPLMSAGAIHCYDPATGYVLGTVPADSPETIRTKIARAADAQRAWRTSSMAQRRLVLRTLHAWIQRDLEPIARIACRDTGKTAIDAAFGELLTTCAKLAWTLRHGERVLRPERRYGNLLLAHKTCTVVHEPLGVVAACVSWNYPVHNMLGPIISALFTGNAIVVKGSEHVAWSSQHMLEGVRRCLAACGAPVDAVQLVVCGPDAVEALTRDPRIAHITFIGSDVVGRRVASAAAPQLTPTTLELGGKDPAVVLPDTDLSFFASMFLRACFQAMGQNCIGIERFLVPAARIDEFVALVLPRIRMLRPGSTLDDTRFGTHEADTDGVDVGAMISDARFDTLEALIRDAVAQGAQLHTGGKRLAHSRWPLGHYFAPTLLTHVTPAMRIAREELFAPVFVIMAYDSVDEAVQIANGTPYGLGASVFGRSRAQCRSVAAQLECGMVNINEYVALLTQLWHLVPEPGLAVRRVQALGLRALWWPRGSLGPHSAQGAHGGYPVWACPNGDSASGRLPRARYAAQLDVSALARAPRVRLVVGTCAGNSRFVLTMAVAVDRCRSTRRAPGGAL